MTVKTFLAFYLLGAAVAYVAHAAAPVVQELLSAAKRRMAAGAINLQLQQFEAHMLPQFGSKTIAELGVLNNAIRVALARAQKLQYHTETGMIAGNRWRVRSPFGETIVIVEGPSSSIVEEVNGPVDERGVLIWLTKLWRPTLIDTLLFRDVAVACERRVQAQVAA